MALLLGDRSRGEKIKTGSGQGVEVLMTVTKCILQTLSEGLSDDELVIPITPDKYRRSWQASLRRLGLEALGPPHGIRHAGAAQYVANGGDLEIARRRGRWTTSSALQRYTKTHVLIRRRALLQQDQVLRGERFWQAPGLAIATALEKSKAAHRPLTVRLVRALSELQNDAIDLGCASSQARPEVGQPRPRGRALLRRRGGD